MPSKSYCHQKNPNFIDLPGSEGRWRKAAGHFISARCSQMKCGKVQSAISILAVLVAPPSDLVSKTFGVGYHRSECNVYNTQQFTTSLHFTNTKFGYTYSIMEQTMPSNSVDSSLTQLHFTLLNKYIRINKPRRRLTLDVRHLESHGRINRQS